MSIWFIVGLGAAFIFVNYVVTVAIGTGLGVAVAVVPLVLSAVFALVGTRVLTVFAKRGVLVVTSERAAAQSRRRAYAAGVGFIVVGLMIAIIWSVRAI